MDRRQLRYFLRVVELGNLSRAAEALHVAQPALSAHVRRLEEELGVQLLVRTPRGVTPTPHGQLLAEHAISILRQFEQARQEVMALGHEPHGDVALGIPATVSPVLIRPLLEALRERAPRVVPHIVEAMSGYLLEWLHASRLDAAILFGVQSPVGLQRSEIGIEEMFLVGPPQAFGRGEKIPMAQLPRFPLIIPGRMQGMNQLIRGAAARHNIHLNVVVEVDAVAEMIGLAEQGLGYTILAPMGYRRGLEAGKVSVARIVDPPLLRTLVSATAASRPISPATRLVLELAHSILSQYIADTSGGAA
ncbi:MAG: LysR family transcriptional regulator [Burkholderiales bacterium]|nr:LysR family transcriptional regulator [Burkholderiales bacterium]